MKIFTRTSGFLILNLLFLPCIFAQPSNDLCSGATSITCGGSVSGNTSTATNDVLPSPSCTSASATRGLFKGVWFTVTPTSAGSLTISACTGTTWDTYMRVFSGGSCGSFTTCHGFNDDGCSNQSTLTFTAVASTTYYVLLAGYDDDSGAYTISATCPISCPAPTSVANNTITYNSANITWACTGCTGTFDIDYGANPHTAGTGTIITGVTSPYALTGLSASTAYTVYVRQNCSGSGNGNSTWSSGTNFTTLAAPPTNDACSSATAITCGGSVSGNTSAATNDVLPSPSCSGGSSTNGLFKGVWFTVAPTNSGSLTISTCTGTTWDTYMRVYSGGSCGAFTTCHGFSDDDCSSQSTLTFTAVGGTTYYVLLAGYDADDLGAYTISATCPISCPTPTSVANNTIAHNSANITWTCTGCTGTFDIDYGATPHTAGTGTIITGVTSPYALTGLSPSTAYTVYVRQNCSGSGNGNSAWSSGTSFTTLVAPPDCASASSLSCGVSESATLSTGSGAWNPDTASPGACFSTPGREKVYKFTSTTAGTYTLMVTSSTGSSFIDYFFKTASACSEANWTCIDDFDAEGSATFTLAAATDYYILLDNESTSSSMSQTFRIDCPAPPPANDACSGAIAVTLGTAPVTVANGLVAENNPSGNPSCNDTDTKNDLWYSFTTSSSLPNNLIFNTTAGSIDDAVMVLYSGACTGLSEVLCSDDAVGNMPQITTCALTPSTTYHIRLYPYFSDDIGNYTFEVDEGSACPSPPTNDACSAAQTISGSATSGTTVYAMPAAMAQPSCDNFGTINDVWYTFNSGTEDSRLISATVSFSNVQSDKTLEAAIYKGSCGSLVLEPSIATPCISPISSASQFTINGLDEGQDYFIRVWSNSSATAGTFDISLSASTSFSSAAIASGTINNCDAFTNATIDATNVNKWVPLMDGTNTLVAEIKSVGTVGTVSGSYYVNSGTVRTGGTAYLDRNIAISFGGPASVRIYFTNAELAALLAANGGQQPDGATKEAGACAAASAGGGSFINGTFGSGADGVYLEFAVSSFSDFFVHKGPAPLGLLPVELMYVRGTAEHDANLLEWATASEQNSQYHVVERSANGATNWLEIGRHNGAGTSYEAQTYRFTDDRPLQMNYYRLKMVDFDGSFEYSKIISIERTLVDFAVTNAYPRPASKEVTLQVSLQEATTLTIVITNLTGHTLAATQVDAAKGISDVKLDVADYAPGTYFVTIDNGIRKLTERIVKQ